MGGICCEKVEGCQWRNKYKQSPFNVGVMFLKTTVQNETS